MQTIYTEHILVMGYAADAPSWHIEDPDALKSWTETAPSITSHPSVRNNNLSACVRSFRLTSSKTEDSARKLAALANRQEARIITFFPLDQSVLVTDKLHIITSTGAHPCLARKLVKPAKPKQRAR